MKILIFSAQYLPTLGGVERYTKSISDKLIEKNNEVVIITSHKKGLKYYEKDSNGIEIYRLPSKWLMGDRFPVLIYNSKFKEIIKEIDQINFDFCIIQTRFYINSIFAAKYVNDKRIKSIVIEHGSAYLIRDGLIGNLGILYEKFAVKIINLYIKDFYGVSNVSCKWLKNFKIQSKGTLYNAVDVKNLYELKSDKYSYLNEKETICFVGRFIKEKGVLNLVEAFENLKKTYPGLTLIMAGEGPLLNDIIKKNIEGIQCVGKLSYNDTLSLIYYSKIFILPSFSEGFSTTVLEAAALKTLIITTKTGGSPELIINEDYGYMLESMESDDIVSGVNKALRDRSSISIKTENTYNLLQNNFTWEKVVDKLLGIISLK